MSNDDLKTVKEIAGILRRDPSYVYALRQDMVRQGFAWTAGQSTMATVKAFFAQNPTWKRGRVKWGATRPTS